MSRFNRYLKMNLLAFCFFIWTIPALAVNSQSGIEKEYYSWCSAIKKDNADAVVKHYSPNAILLPTLSSEILLQAENQIKPYFVKLTHREGIKCIPQRLITHTHANIGVNSGLYTFEYIEKGKTIAIPARFTFVYKKINNKWLIIEHHSSIVPI